MISAVESVAGVPNNVTRWRGIAVSIGHQIDLQSELILAVIWQESGGNPNASGSADEIGLMQVTIDAALDIYPLQIPNLENPEANVDIGSQYLKRQIEYFGSVTKGLQAYNAGRGNVISDPNISIRYANSVLLKQDKLLENSGHTVL